MEWPSKNVTPGGIFHSKQIDYSPDNHRFIKLLNEETKFAMIDCKSRNYHLRNGNKSLLVPSRINATKEENILRAKRKLPVVLIRPTTSKRRSQQTIAESGVYHREKFKPLPDARLDRDKEIGRLQERMANCGSSGGDDNNLGLKRPNQKEKQKNESCNNRFDQLVQEIEDRQQFLMEMEKLGEKKNYEKLINEEIQLRIREMEKLNLK